MFTGTSSSKPFAAMQFSFQLAPHKRAFSHTQGILPHTSRLGCLLFGIHVACDPLAGRSSQRPRPGLWWERMSSIPLLAMVSSEKMGTTERDGHEFHPCPPAMSTKGSITTPCPDDESLELLE